MTRDTLADLVRRLRTLINDEAGTVWSDDRLCLFLDDYRQEIRYEQLIYAETYTTGGHVQYLEYYAPSGWWETGAELLDHTFTVVTPAVSDLLVGKWTFATSTVPPVFIRGSQFDIYASAADVLTAQAARVMLDFDFVSEAAAKYSRSQKHAQLLAQANEYRARSIPRSARLHRTDMDRRIRA